MPVQPSYPGVYVQEVPSAVRPIDGVGTSIAAFVGRTARGPANDPQRCLDYEAFAGLFGTAAAGLSDLPWAVRLFFENGGADCYALRIAPGDRDEPTATGDRRGAGRAARASDYLAAYEVLDRKVDLFDLLVLPGDHAADAVDPAALWADGSAFCKRRRAFLLVDPPSAWADAGTAAVGVETLRKDLVRDHAAVFFPRLRIEGEGRERLVGPSGAIAGLVARIDRERGLWKAPAGTEANLRGVLGVEHVLADADSAVLNPRAVNAIRSFPRGICVWGSRTLDGDDAFGSEFKYIPVRRLASFIEESVLRGTQWTVFEPNGEPLWSQVRLNLGAFMHLLFRRGAFQGTTPAEAYFVKCDRETTTQDDILNGVVRFQVGFAPLKPAEFIVLQFEQQAAEADP